MEQKKKKAMPTTWKKCWNYAVPFSAAQHKVIFAMGAAHYDNQGDLFTIEEIAASINIPVSTTHYSISKLVERGLMICYGQRDYHLTIFGLKLFHRIWKQEYIIKQKWRPHNIYIVVPLIQPPKDYESLKTKFTHVVSKRNRIYEYSDATFTFCGKTTLVVHLMEFSSPLFDKLHDVKFYIKQHYLDILLELLEANFDMRINRDNVDVKVQHIALVEAQVAKYFHRVNRSFLGNRIDIDASKGDPEIEWKSQNGDSIEVAAVALPFIRELEEKLERMYSEKKADSGMENTE